jgi:hypothetical protein
VGKSPDESSVVAALLSHDADCEVVVSVLSVAGGAVLIVDDAQLLSDWAWEGSFKLVESTGLFSLSLEK